jgi:hypothetical protein
MTDIYTALNFEGGNKTTSTFAADMLMVVQKLQGDEVVSCFQYGGWNIKYAEVCGVVAKWPTSWNHHDSGFYNATAATSRANFTGSSWKICVGNGYSTSYVVGYEGSFDFSPSLMTTGIPPTSMPSGPPSPAPSISPAPTQKPFSQPTAIPTISFPPTPAPTHTPTSLPTVTSMPTSDPWTVTSSCDGDMQLSFDVSLAGKQLVCADFPASDSLSFVNISLEFSGSSGGEWPYDMAMVVKPVESSGIQVGGFNYYLKDISYAGAWPSSWRTNKAGLYVAEKNVTQYHVTGEGYYGICIVNAWSTAKRVHYQGTVKLKGLKYRCDITPRPSSTPTLAPTVMPSLWPTKAPSAAPTVAPSGAPTSVPAPAPNPRYGRIYQSSLPGEPAKVNFDLSVAGGVIWCDVMS